MAGKQTDSSASRKIESRFHGSLDALAGVFSSHGMFQMLVWAVLKQTRRRNSSIMFIGTAYEVIER